MGMDLEELKSRQERLPDFLRSNQVRKNNCGSMHGLNCQIELNQVGPDGERSVPSDRNLGCQFVVAVLVKILAIVMIAVGASNLENCQAEPMVPRYLVGESELQIN